MHGSLGVRDKKALIVVIRVWTSIRGCHGGGTHGTGTYAYYARKTDTDGGSIPPSICQICFQAFLTYTLGEAGMKWAMNPDIDPFTEQKGRKKDFCRLRRVVLISQALATEGSEGGVLFALLNSRLASNLAKGKGIRNLNLSFLKVVFFSYMGDRVLLPLTGSLMHQWSQFFLPFF